MLTIVITTFSKRYNLVSSLIKQIRTYSDLKVILLINGEQDGNFNEEYRTKILNLSVAYKNIYPIFFIETRGLAKMWNTGIIHSNTDNILMLNDDIIINSKEIFDTAFSVITNHEYTGLTVINKSFSHFIINKIVIHKIGYFDERLLGFGEEDGDITYRFEKEKLKINSISVSSVINIVSDIRHDHIKPEISKYSKFNIDFICKEKYKVNTDSFYKGIFDNPMDIILADETQYPYEKFFRQNKDKL